ncbi:peroxidase [Streptomyces antimicrobicus]|uniref:Peroxidase n=1 Tax=Streptomyces antimicrobicus TaxID=2883108 RepID=A0ABS8BDQ0_9ACTN|nr:peroxidase [Streptomyces antimicrobicus]MCB5182740.1 peroxidase [Streptomyces antimicrobicus]
MECSPSPHPARRTVVRAGACAAAAFAVGGGTAAAAPAVAAGPPAPAAAPEAVSRAAAELPLRADASTQGDILAGFRKDHACLLFVHFRDAGQARRWLGALLPELATTDQVARFNAEFSKARRLRKGVDPTRMSVLWAGISLTYPGLALLADKDPFPAVRAGSTAEAFAEGAATRAEALGDTGPSAPDGWLFGASQDEVHAVLTLAGDDARRLAEAVERHERALDRAQAAVLFRQDAATLPDALRGHEHFGFLDAISQPGVRGFDAPDPQSGTTVLGKPGTRLVPAGEFLVGHEKVGQRPAGLPVWATGGSFHVVRRLAQDVAGWWDQLGECLDRLKRSGAAPADADTRWLASRMVGRWPGGAPVATCPAAERIPVPGEDIDGPLDFHDDPNGWTTPLFAHIRKSNPRAGLTLAPGRPPLPAGDVDARRIIRRGIPFGPPLRRDARGVVDGRSDDGSARGLVFVSHQADLVEQFEFIVKRWTNERDFPPARHPVTGCDPVIGPASPAAFESPSADGGRATTLAFQQFVRTEGAVYAFTPSVPALRALAAGKLDTAIEVHRGTVLRPGDVLDAGAVRLLLDTDGDLVLQDDQERALWTSGTTGKGVDAYFSADGELRVRAAGGRTVWSSGTAGHEDARLLVRPSGDAVILAGDRRLWRVAAPGRGGGAR